MLDPSRRHLLVALTFLLCVVLLAACGGSSAAPTPTRTAAPIVTTRPAVAAPRAVAVARSFLKAFQGGHARTMLSLMTPRLLLRDHTQRVADMLGAQSVPSTITIKRARTRHSGTRTWTTVVATLEFDHGTVTDRLGILKTPAGWKVNTLQRVSSGT